MVISYNLVRKMGGEVQPLVWDWAGVLLEEELGPKRFLLPRLVPGLWQSYWRFYPQVVEVFLRLLIMK